MRLTGKIGRLAAGVLVLTIATAGVALAAQTQAVDYYVKAKTLSKVEMAPVALKIHTATADPTSPNGIPSHAVRALINFDDDIDVDFRLKGLGKCAPSAIATLSTAQAKATCSRAIVGGGAAKVRIESEGSFLELRATVTAFNATREPGTGRPRLIIHGWQPDTARVNQSVAVFKKSGAGADYGMLLDMNIPLLLEGAAAMTDFRLTIGNGYQKGFVSARCHDSNRRIDMKTRYYFQDDTSLPASDYELCKRK
ncbi:MAG: hypothetical protein ACKOBH_02140 [bacterium]